MRPAQEKLKPDLDAAHFQDLETPLVNNWRAGEIRAAAEARQGLFEQIPNPVLWTQSIRRLVENGVDRWYEIGAGSVLTGLLRSIAPGAQAIAFGEARDASKL
jgi:[acyl-carrier-protein] S-malonyltransferase